MHAGVILSFFKFLKFTEISSSFLLSKLIKVCFFLVKIESSKHRPLSRNQSLFRTDIVPYHEAFILVIFVHVSLDASYLKSLLSIILFRLK